MLACWSLVKVCPCLLVTLPMISFFFSDRESPTRAVPVQEAEDLAPGEQRAAVPALPGGRADESVADRAAGEPPGVFARGAGGVPAAQTQWARGGGGSLQHPALGGQGAPLEGRQRASLSPRDKGKASGQLEGSKRPFQSPFTQMLPFLHSNRYQTGQGVLDKHGSE